MEMFPEMTECCIVSWVTSSGYNLKIHIGHQSKNPNSRHVDMVESIDFMISRETYYMIYQIVIQALNRMAKISEHQATADLTNDISLQWHFSQIIIT